MALSPDSLHKKGGRLQPCILPRGDVIIFVMHPVRLVISKDSCLAFDPGDPTVRSVIADIASAIKIQQLEQVGRMNDTVCDVCLHMYYHLHPKHIHHTYTHIHRRTCNSNTPP